MTVELINADCLEHMRGLPDNSIDAIVTDPPYGLSFMGKGWDKGVPSADVWAEALRVLKPGGYLLAFAGTRTQHRMAVAIEDGGFEIRDMIAWVYGQGFPKSHNLKNEWDGWGTALKPALEPITVARKPFKGTVAANVLAHGTGALNVDGCRVEGHKRSPEFKNPQSKGQWGSVEQQKEWDNTQGRWPANLIHDGSDEVTRLFPEKGCSGTAVRRNGNQAKGMFPVSIAEGSDDVGYSDSGSAARFFYCAKASKKDRDEGCEGLDEDARRMFASGGRTMKDGAWVETNSEPLPRRNFHPTVKPTDLMRYLCRLVTPPGGTVYDPFMGSGSTGKAAILEGFNFIGIELDAEYCEIARSRIAAATDQTDMFTQATETGWRHDG